ncbi:MAG: hypothetical protein ACRCTE_10590 [Cellulosilyticaceae bacterium]
MTEGLSSKWLRLMPKGWKAGRLEIEATSGARLEVEKLGVGMGSVASGVGAVVGMGSVASGVGAVVGIGSVASGVGVGFGIGAGVTGVGIEIKVESEGG